VLVQEKAVRPEGLAALFVIYRNVAHREVRHTYMKPGRCGHLPGTENQIVVETQGDSIYPYTP
jgi:hypothetical protein